MKRNMSRVADILLSQTSEDLGKLCRVISKISEVFELMTAKPAWKRRSMPFNVFQAQMRNAIQKTRGWNMRAIYALMVVSGMK
ncbi:MAG: hypothetical protein B6245_10465 [Desulfobacteraceae bacterium 4572_88]|nr:MAG: hypothetical protein B6245_10465 [Desulfobacteraceae bacterium 4572_88]